MTKRVVYCDADGVIFDFDGKCKELGILPKEAKHITGFYRSLPIFPEAKEYLEKINERGYPIFILTKCPHNNNHAASEKMESVNEHFNWLRNKVIITPDKSLVGTVNDILIDDHINENWANAGRFLGKKIHFYNWKQAYKEFLDA